MLKRRDRHDEEVCSVMRNRKPMKSFIKQNIDSFILLFGTARSVLRY